MVSQNQVVAPGVPGKSGSHRNQSKVNANLKRRIKMATSLGSLRRRSLFQMALKTVIPISACVLRFAL